MKRFEVYNADNYEEDEMIAYIGSNEQWIEFINNYPHTSIHVNKDYRIENGIEIYEVWVSNQ